MNLRNTSARFAGGLLAKALLMFAILMVLSKTHALPLPAELERRGAAPTTTTKAATTTPNPTPTNAVDQALVLTKEGGEAAATFALDTYNVPYMVLAIPNSGINQLNLEVDGRGNFSMVIMTSSLFDTVNGAWQCLLTQTQIATLHNYLVKYNAKLVRLADSPDPATGVTNVGWGTGIDHPIAFHSQAASLATNVGLNHLITFSSDGLYHYPGKITNSTRAKPILLFKSVKPDFPQDTIAAAHITLPAPGGGTFQQLSFYLPFTQWHVTSVNLAKVWLNWVSNRAYPPTVSRLNSFRVNQKGLIISGLWDDSTAVTNVLKGYGMPYDLYVAGSGDLQLEAEPNAVGLYSFIVSTGPLASIPPHQQWLINSYVIKYNIRIVVLNDQPDPATGVTTANGMGSGDDQRVYFSSNSEGLTLAVRAGIQTTATFSTAGLYHVPAKIVNTAVAKPVLLFEPNSAFPNPTVAAAQILFPGYQQLSFYLPFGFWSLTSSVLGHAWFTWATRGFYIGFRRILFSTIVDDMFMSTGPENSVDFRLTRHDMAAVQRWQSDINTRMNPGSLYRLDLAFNGNGVFIEAFKKTNQSAVRPIVLDFSGSPAGEIQGQSQIKKGSWSPITTTQYSSANINRNVNSFRQNDLLFNYILSNQSHFFWSSHTFTHQSLTSASYQDAFNDLILNKNFARALNIDTKTWWSSHSFVSPHASGAFNGEALKAMRDAGYTSMTGDIAKPEINNNTNPRWPFVTSIASSNFDGIAVIPRSATLIFYNSTTAAENEEMYASFYPNKPQTFSQILKADTDRVLYKLMNLHWDPYMFHQANLRSTDLPESTGLRSSGSRPLSSYNSITKFYGAGRNGTTRAYSQGNLSILGAWTESVVQAFNQLVSWPMVTVKLDDIEDMYRDRAIRENCGASIVMSADSNGFGRFTISSQSPCVIPIAFPAGISQSHIAGFPSNTRFERRGYDPLTAWVALNGRTPVVVTLNKKIPFV
ncbi:hypothetical protein HDV05_004457 [Chytridiales sp. JEL 0842]|nr:hypothetical protein HDV05_004457 [Chytridiales sp. JEL 0842]